MVVFGLDAMRTIDEDHDERGTRWGEPFEGGCRIRITSAGNWAQHLALDGWDGPRTRKLLKFSC